MQDKHVKQYVLHMENLHFRKAKRSEKADQVGKTALNKAYKDYNWHGMFENNTLGRLRVHELDKYLLHHNLLVGQKVNKVVKVRTVRAHIAKETLSRNDGQENDENVDWGDAGSVGSDAGSDGNDAVSDEIDDGSNESDAVSEESENSDDDLVYCAIGGHTDTTTITTRSGRVVKSNRRYLYYWRTRVVLLTVILIPSTFVQMRGLAYSVLY